MPTTPKISQLVATWMIAVAAFFGWAAAVALTVVDGTSVDLPDPTITGTYAFAVTSSFVAVQFGLSYSAQKRVIKCVDAGVAALKEDTAAVKTDTGNLPKITDAMLDMPTLADVVASVAQLAGEVEKLSTHLAQDQDAALWRAYLSRAIDQEGPDGEPH